MRHILKNLGDAKEVPCTRQEWFIFLLGLTRAHEAYDDARTPKIYPISACIKFSTFSSASPPAPILHEVVVAAVVIYHPDE
jgi:hypothetical protein